MHSFQFSNSTAISIFEQVNLFSKKRINKTLDQRYPHRGVGAHEWWNCWKMGTLAIRIQTKTCFTGTATGSCERDFFPFDHVERVEKAWKVSQKNKLNVFLIFKKCKQLLSWGFGSYWEIMKGICSPSDDIQRTLIPPRSNPPPQQLKDEIKY